MKYLLLLFFSLFFLYSTAQTFTEKYDLDFRRFNDHCPWEWHGAFGSFTFISIDSTCFINKKHPIKISSTIGKFSSMPNIRTIFALKQIVVLPSYKVGEECTVTINAKSNALDSAFLVIRSFDYNENVLFKDSISLNNSEWNNKTLSFNLSSEKAVGININYYGNKNPEQNIWLDKITIKIGGKDIGKASVLKKDKEVPQLNSDQIIPLSINIDESLCPLLVHITDKKIIGLAECTHGSYQIKQSIYQTMRTLIGNSNVKLLLFELPSDMLLKYDLYVQGHTPEEYINQIEEDARCFYTDYKLLVELLSWLRDYNTNREKGKVHILGFDGVSVPQFSLRQYYSTLLNEKDRAPYLELIEKKQYDQLIELSKSDTTLNRILDKKSIDFYYHILENFILTKNPGYNRKYERELGMAQKTKDAIDIFLTDDEKVIVHAHSGHLTKVQSIRHYPLKHFPTGYFLSNWYGEKYYNISFQVGEGTYTDNICDPESDFIAICPLSKPLPLSFEGVSLKSDLDYFYYPSLYLSDDIILTNQFGRASCKKNKDGFMSLKKHFDGYVFIRESTPLKNAENNPTSYMIQYTANTR